MERASCLAIKFSRAVCRGFVPAEGVAVRLSLLGPDGADIFAIRAGFVERATEWPELPVLHTVRGLPKYQKTAFLELSAEDPPRVLLR